MTLDTQSDIRFHWHCTCHYICGNVAEMCKGKCRNSACVCRGPCQWGPVRLPYTHVGGFLLSQLKFLLCVFKSLGVLVKLILSSLELLLQSYQIVLKLVCVCVCVCFIGVVVQKDSGGDQQETGVREGVQHRREAERQTGEKQQEEEERRRGVRPVRMERYLSGHLLSGQQLLLRGLALLKQFVSLVLGNAQFLFQLSYVIL